MFHMIMMFKTKYQWTDLRLSISGFIALQPFSQTNIKIIQAFNANRMRKTHKNKNQKEQEKKARSYFRTQW